MVAQFGITAYAINKIGKAAATDADQVHDTVAGGSEVRSRYLAEDGHIVAIKKAPAEPKQNQKGHGDGERGSIADAHERGHDGQHADGTDIDPTTHRFAHPQISQPATQKRPPNAAKLTYKVADTPATLVLTRSDS